MTTEQDDLDHLRAVFGLGEVDHVSEGPGTFVASTRVLHRGAESLWVLRARAGLVRPPFEGVSAAGRLAPREVPIAPVRRAEPPVVLVSSALRAPPVGRSGAQWIARDPAARPEVFRALGRVLARLGGTPAFGCSLQAEGGRFLAAPSWRAAAEVELARIGRALSASTLDLGRLEADLLARARAAAVACPEPEEPCLLHGSLSDGHLRFDDTGALVEVSGWEFAGIGDPLCDVGPQLLLDRPDWEVVRAELPPGWDRGPAVAERLVLGATLGALRTLATVSASMSSLSPGERAGWHERCRILAEQALAVDPASMLAGGPSPQVRPPSSDRVAAFRMSAALGARPAPLAIDALPLAAVIAVLELGDDEHRELAHDGASRLLARFDARAPGRGGEPVDLDAAIDAIDALRPEGQALALCAGRVVRALVQLLGPGMAASSRAAAVEWLAAARARFEVAEGPARQLLDHALVSWARPEARGALRGPARAAFAALPPGPLPGRTARFQALAVVSVAPTAPLLVRGLDALGFSDEEIRRALPPCVPIVDWGGPAPGPTA